MSALCDSAMSSMSAVQVIVICRPQAFTRQHLSVRAMPLQTGHWQPFGSCAAVWSAISLPNRERLMQGQICV